MRYDPFARGPYPAGVRTSLLSDAARGDRAVPIEVWYPADARHEGADLSADSRDTYDLVPGLAKVPQDAVRNALPHPGRRPLVVFSHGLGGHRRQSTFLCTHLASHGYVVASCDHSGSTMLDLLRMRLQAQRERPEPGSLEARISAPRLTDVRFVLDRVLDGSAGALADLVDPGRVAATGHSLGGWTALMLTQADPRVGTLALLAPAGGRTHVDSRALRDALDFRWGRPVPSLWIAADRDSVLPLDGVEALHAEAAAPKRLVVLERTDHMHFCDRGDQLHELFRTAPPPGVFARAARHMAPIGELTEPERARTVVRGLVLAHLDATIAANEAAAALLDDGVDAGLAWHGVGSRGA